MKIKIKIRCLNMLIGFIKHISQKVFRKTHTSDRDLWGLDYGLAKMILPKLQQYYKHNMWGFPYGFESEEDWKACIAKMIFAFEYMLYDGMYNRKFQKYFEKKYGNINLPVESNKKRLLWYRDEKNKTLCSDPLSGKLDNVWGFYCDDKLRNEFSERYQEGIMLFAKYFDQIGD